MALTPQEFQQYKKMYNQRQKSGQFTALPTKKDTGSFLTRSVDRFKENVGDVKDAYLGIGEKLYEAGENIVDTAQRSDLNLGEKVLQGTGQAFAGGFGALGEATIGAAKTLVSDETEQRIGNKIQEVATSAIDYAQETETGKDIAYFWENLSPRQKELYGTVGQFGEALSELAGLGIAGKGLNTAIDVTRPCGRNWIKYY